VLTNTNRAGVRASIKQWSQRKNIPDEVLNDFIEIALSKANWALRIPPLEAVAVMTIDAEGLTMLPANYIEAKEFAVTVDGDIISLDRKSIIEVNNLGNNVPSGAKPTAFGRFGQFLKVAPWNLGEVDNAVLYYYQALPTLTDDLSTNWFTKYCPEILLYGALVELCNYTRDAEGAALWAEKFTQAINTLQAVEERANWSGSTLAVSLQGS